MLQIKSKHSIHPLLSLLNHNQPTHTHICSIFYLSFFYCLLCKSYIPALSLMQFNATIWWWQDVVLFILLSNNFICFFFLYSFLCFVLAKVQCIPISFCFVYVFFFLLFKFSVFPFVSPLSLSAINVFVCLCFICVCVCICVRVCACVWEGSWQGKRGKVLERTTKRFGNAFLHQNNFGQ